MRSGDGPDTAPPEIRPLTGLRTLLAWWVVFYHFMPRSEGFAGRVVAHGHVAVDVFFVLSGYVLTRRYVHGDLTARVARRAFWRRRVARLYPLYVVSLAIGIVAGLPASLVLLATADGVFRVSLQLLALNAWWHRIMFQPNWAAWSLSVEAFFYLLFPWLLTLLRRQSARAQVGLLLSCYLLLLVPPSLYCARDPDLLGRPLARGDEVLCAWYLKFFPLQRLPEFVAGMLAALLSSALPFFAMLRHAHVAAGVAGVGLVASTLTELVPLPYLYTGVSLPFIVALVVSLDRPARGWLGTRALVALGHASFATYILHVPVYRLMRGVLPWLEEGSSLFILYLLTLLGVSLLAYHAVERPALRLLSRHRAARCAVSEERAAPTG